MILADVAIILMVGIAIAPLRTRLRQPVVVGEIAAGILLGPSVLGLLPGDLPERLFPSEVRPHLATVAQVGIALFMFTAGWELDFPALRGRLRSVLAVTTTSLAVPFALAVGVAFVLAAKHPGVTGADTPTGVFAAFMGIVMSISALAVLVRIVKENGLQNSPAGTMATACGALTETIAWCALATLVAAARGTGQSCLVTLLHVAVYAVVMAFGVRPLLRTALHRVTREAGHHVLPILLIASGVLLSSCITAWIGIHAVLGAFAFGLVMPRDLAPDTRRSVESPLQHTGTLLIPLFFALTGLSVDIGSLGRAGALELIAFLAVAWAGKFAGTTLGARLIGLPWCDARMLAVFLNTKGLGEVIMLTIGRNAGIIDDEVFTAMLVTALLATASVNPLVRYLAGKSATQNTAPAVPAQAVRKAPVEIVDRHEGESPASYGSG
ncbi:cation:proton antiporter [Streptomyces cinnamoneus]|uniref:cation:proton antiporter n=1 Tax=Streptomyces cinnamoneus TaxID=53446 RepID=UPI003420B585